MKKTYRVARRWAAAAALATVILIGLGCAGIWRAHQLMEVVLNGREARIRETAYISEFALRAQMYSTQAAARVSGWHTVVMQEEITLDAGHHKHYARMYEPIGGNGHEPWALVLHGGLGTDGMQLIDVACELSLAGYRVLLPDLSAHGRSDGTISLLGAAQSRDVCAWVNWIKNRDAKAKIVVYGMDEGAVAALLAAPQLGDHIAAIAADSAYLNTADRAEQLLVEKTGTVSVMDRVLFETAYRLLAERKGGETDVLSQIQQSSIALLLIHGTGDEDVPAWQSEDMAKAGGKNAQLLLIEGAAHEEARFLEPEEYYDALLSFFDKAQH